MTADASTPSSAPTPTPVPGPSPVPGRSPVPRPTPVPGPPAALQPVPDYVAEVPDLTTAAADRASGADDASGRIGPEELDAALDAAAAAHRGLQAHLQGDQRT